MRATRTVQAAVVAASAIAGLTVATAPSGAAPCSGEASFDQQTDTTVPLYGRAFMLWVDDKGQYAGGGRNMGDESRENDGYFEVYVDGPTVDNNFGPAPAAPLCLSAQSLPGPGALPGVPADLVPAATTTTTSTTTTSTTSTTVAAAAPGDGERALVLGARSSRSSGSSGSGMARTGGDVAGAVGLGAFLLAMGAACVHAARGRRAET